MHTTYYKAQKKCHRCPGILPEVFQAASRAVEHWLLQRQMTLAKFDSCALAKSIAKSIGKSDGNPDGKWEILWTWGIKHGWQGNPGNPPKWRFPGKSL